MYAASSAATFSVSKSMLILCSQPLKCGLLTWSSCPSLPAVCITSCVLFDCPVSSSVETVCGWFPCIGMTRAKVRSFHDSFPLCCTQCMVFWVSHSDAKHRRDFLHTEALEIPLCPELEGLSSYYLLKCTVFFPMISCAHLCPLFYV